MHRMGIVRANHWDIATIHLTCCIVLFDFCLSYCGVDDSAFIPSLLTIESVVFTSYFEQFWVFKMRELRLLTLYKNLTPSFDVSTSTMAGRSDFTFNCVSLVSQWRIFIFPLCHIECYFVSIRLSTWCHHCQFTLALVGFLWSVLEAWRDEYSLHRSSPTIA